MNHKATPLNPVVQQMFERLECWELEHLRTLAAAQDARIALLEKRIWHMQDEVEQAWTNADMWRDDAMRITETLRGDGYTAGITQDGHLVAVKKETEACQPIKKN